MRILSVHNSYLLSGGEDKSWEAQNNLLCEYGHQVEIYHEHNRRIQEIGLLRTVGRTLWSAESYRNIQRKLIETKADIVHCENTFPLISPSIYYAAQAMGIPVVQSLRNYRLSCLNAYLYRDGKPCEECVGRSLAIPGIANRCYQDNAAASAAVAAMLALHWKMGTYQKQVDMFVALTDFAKDKYVQFGIPEKKIVVKPNFIHPDPGIGTSDGNFALFVGRLSEEKGLRILLEAWQSLGQYLPLKILGDGPLRGFVEESQRQISGVEYLGLKPSEEVHQLMGDAHALIFPSQWYEGMPRVIIESYAKGTPVIASNMGAMSKLIEHGITGFHFQSNDATSLTTQVIRSLQDLESWKRMRENARHKFETQFSASINYKALFKIYDEAMAKKR